MPAAQDRERVEARTVGELRGWLRKHHRQRASVWLVTWKKGRGDSPYIPRRKVMEALLSYGWIDSLSRKLDDDRTMLLISRRKVGSSWSKINRDIAEALMASGDMHKPGQNAVDLARQDGSWQRLTDVDKLAVPADLASALQQHTGARAFFDRFPPSSRRGILEWIQNAKRPETRARRVAETAQKAAENIKANHPRGRDRGPAPDGARPGRSPGKSPRKKATSDQPTLLSGGNPQIPKADGDAPVQAYIAAMPGWKSAVGRELDALIEGHVPGVQKAVRWNSPFYGVQGKGWFLSFHCFNKYIKVTWLNGASLKPLPPVESKHPDARYLHIHENEPMDQSLVTRWVKQAARMPGEELF